MNSSTNNIIEELWYGNIDSLNGGIFKSPEMKNLIQYIARHREELEKTLTDEQKEIFESVMNKDYMIIDNGKPYDFGKISVDYAKYRDIYPPIFYEKIAELGLCLNGQTVLDIGTGTGVLPRNMYSYGAKWVGTDISENQIEQARILSATRDIDYYVTPAEELNFPDSSFDVITACQCYWYFQHKQTAPLFYNLLKDNGHLLFLRMDWLPFEDEIAKLSESCCAIIRL